MSLQVWLPLTGDLHNQGLADTNFSGTPAWKTYGKLANSSLNLQNRITCTTPILNGVQFFSVAFWARVEANPDSTANWMDLIGFTDVSTGGTNGQFRFETGYGNAAQGGVHWHDNATNAIISGAYTYNTATEQNNWHHIAVTISDNAVKSYYDGELKQTHTTNLNKGHLSGNWWIGESTTRGCIQDIRIYDHALSDKEVEEIAKGLVLHYKLDTTITTGGNPNLVTGSNTNSTTDNGWVLSEQTGGSTKSIVQDENGIYCVRIERNSTEHAGWRYLGYNKLDINSIQPDTWYTVSFDIKSNVAGTIEFYGLIQANATNSITDGSTRQNIQGIVTANQWSHIVLQIKTLSSFSGITVGTQIVYLTASLSLYDINNVILFKNIKLEEGQVETPWCPNINDSAYTSYNNTLIPDSSGYNNNGIIVGDLSVKSISAKYSCSLNFSNSQYIKCTPFYFDTDKWTYSFWYYKTAQPSAYEGMICLSKGNGADANKKFAAMPNTNKIWVKCESGSGNLSSLLVNQWVHIVGTSDGKIYENGIEKVTVTPGTVMTGCTDLVIGARAAASGVSSVTTLYNGRISDVRIYATVLTEEQILELYHTSATIDNLGNVYSREYNENGKTSITKTGQFQIDKIYDNNDLTKASILKDENQIQGFTIYEY